MWGWRKDVETKDVEIKAPLTLWMLSMTIKVCVFSVYFVVRVILQKLPSCPKISSF